jgi:protein MpaA
LKFNLSLPALALLALVCSEAAAYESRPAVIADAEPDSAETVEPIASVAPVETIAPYPTVEPAETLETIIADDSMQAVCSRIADKLASVSYPECARLNMQFSGHRSVDGTPLLVKEFPPLADRRPQARILLVGGTHGDELASISVVFKWMHTLEKHHSGLFHWRINPLMNPDGALRPKHQRTNANGVDLNRNFTTPGSGDGAALAYWRDRTKQNARRYPGPYPLSEPETLWLYQEIRDFKPDVVISVHAPYSLVDYDAPNRDNAPRKIGYLHKNLMGTYPGSLGNYAGLHLGVPVVTLELPHAGIMPTGSQISHLWTDLVRWLIRNT